MTQWIITSSILIAVVAALRFLLRGRISLRLQYALWALVLLRLLIPVSFGSTAFSVMNAVDSAVSGAAYRTSAAVGHIGGTAPDLSISKPDPNTSDEQEAQYEINQQVWQESVTSDKARIGAPITLSDVLKLIWLSGCSAAMLVLLISNLRFYFRLRRSRQLFSAEGCPLPVYISELVDTPCLFGLFRPSIYVTPAAAEDETILRHSIAHETTHFRHGDHIWSFLRGVCLALHWYNPLVWLAASLSRRDAELACDESTIKRLGEAERLEYGRTLIDLTCRRHTALMLTATTMTGGRRSIKERVSLIAKKPKMAVYTFAAVLLIAAAAAGCTFTGSESDNEPWTLLRGLSGGDIVSASIQRDSEELARLSDGDVSELISLLNSLESSDFSENAGGDPVSEYRLSFECGGSSCFISQLPSSAGGLVLSGWGDSLWRIDSEELSAFISELISTAEQPLQIEVEAGGSIPQEVIDYAVDYTRAQIAYYGAAGCNIAEAKITGLTKIDIEAEAAEMYLLEYRLLPSEPGSVLPEDGTRIEDGLITERRSSGQPYLLFSNNGKEALKRVGVTNTSAIEGQYCTPEMLDRYGDMYTAAALELLRSWLAEPSWTEIYVAIKPTEVSKSGDDYTYIVPEAQDIWHSAWDEAMLSVEALSDADRAGLLGIQIIYHDSWWQLMENGSLTCYNGKISAENASELYDLALSAAKEAGWAGIVRPSDISNVVSATLDWYGAQQTATDPDILSQIETWLSSSEELYGGAACPFTALLTLELADGESLTVSMATDSCGVWTSEGVSYSYYGENADFYSMFSAALIHDAASEGIDSVLPLMPYIDWTRYYRAFDMDTFELMNMLRDWAAEDGLSDSERTSRYTSVMTWTRALDGAYADYYASVLGELYEKSEAQFAWSCFGYLTDEQQDEVIYLLAYDLGIDSDEMRGILMSVLDE